MNKRAAIIIGAGLALAYIAGHVIKRNGRTVSARMQAVIDEQEARGIYANSYNSHPGYNLLQA